jgi:hypothetical protein
MTEPERALICLCGKNIANHSQEEIRACALKFMGERGEIVTSGFENQPYCCPCGKLYDDHTLFERIACGLEVRARVALEPCPALKGLVLHELLVDLRVILQEVLHHLGQGLIMCHARRVRRVLLRVLVGRVGGDLWCDVVAEAIGKGCEI